MTEETEQRITHTAVAGSRDVRTRRIRLAASIVFVASLLVFGVSGWVVYASTRNTANEGVELSQQVKRDCARGENVGESCEKAEMVEQVAGLPGAAGRDGIDGKDGRDGVDGLDGRDGKDGRDGRDGKDGEDGADSMVPGPTGVPGSPGPSSTVPGPQGPSGADGRGVKSIECTSGKGTFTFNYTDGTRETVSCKKPPDPSPSPTASPSPSPTSTTEPAMRRWIQ